LLKQKDTINCVTLGTNQINIRVNTGMNTAGSVRFYLNGQFIKIDNTKPFTLGGDTPKTLGVTDYLPYSFNRATYTSWTLFPIPVRMAPALKAIGWFAASFSWTSP
jgi:hypothetical protein